MTHIPLAILAGSLFGAAAVLLMLPMQFSDKRAALAAAFLNRFAIGFLVAVSSLPVHPALAGGLIGLMLSLPESIITKAYVPVLGVGVIGGAVIGLLVG